VISSQRAFPPSVTPGALRVYSAFIPRFVRALSSAEHRRARTCSAGESRSIVKSEPAAGDTYKLANQVLIPPRFTPISPHPAANTLIRPLILQDKSFRSSYGPFVVGTVSRIGSARLEIGSNGEQQL
jgi:hypothetical protein